nr:MAG TPA: hypothetical protein [Caudoviricetes sp.]
MKRLLCGFITAKQSVNYVVCTVLRISSILK